jgi:hypothetical protein
VPANKKKRTPKQKRKARSSWLQILIPTAVGVLSVTAVLLGVKTTNDANRAQEHLAEQGQVTERFGNDIGLLGSRDLDVRVGGIYALERLMHDSLADEPKIVEVLSAFIRDHSPQSLPARSHATTSPCRSGATTSKGRPPHPPDDAEAALQVLGRRPVLVGNQPLRDIDLTWAGISGASLPGANLDDADLRCAGLTRAYLIDASLRDTSLRWAYLIDANLTDANLDGAHLPYTNLSHANFKDAKLIGADLTGAKLTGADLSDADLTGAIWPTGAAIPKGWQRDTFSGRLRRAATN